TQEKQKKQYDQKVVETKFYIGNKVLLYKNSAKKLEEKWEGPFYIHDIGLNGTYQLRNQEGKVRKRFVHANRQTPTYLTQTLLTQLLVLNIDDYHSIHIKRMPDTTTTSSAEHLATILLNPIKNQPAIPREDIHNPALIEAQLIKIGIENNFMSTYSLSHNQRLQVSTNSNIIILVKNKSL
ncbi:5944_t:CDS:2, partial [Entrophospora sp. SA101]